MPRHELTPEERRRGQAKGAETKRERREEVQQEARAKLDDAANQAVETLIAELKAEDTMVRIRAAAQILDRAWGRPRQAIETRVYVAPLVTQGAAGDAVDPKQVLQGLVDIGLIQPGRAEPLSTATDPRHGLSAVVAKPCNLTSGCASGTPMARIRHGSKRTADR